MIPLPNIEQILSFAVKVLIVLSALYIAYAAGEMNALALYEEQDRLVDECMWRLDGRLINTAREAMRLVSETDTVLVRILSAIETGALVADVQ